MLHNKNEVAFLVFNVRACPAILKIETGRRYQAFSLVTDPQNHRKGSGIKRFGQSECCTCGLPEPGQVFRMSTVPCSCIHDQILGEVSVGKIFSLLLYNISHAPSG
jgi:hypothetical protein